MATSMYPKTEVGRRVRRADGQMMEEVTTTWVEEGMLKKKTEMREVEGQQRRGKQAEPSNMEEIEALLDGAPDIGGEKRWDSERPSERCKEDFRPSGLGPRKTATRGTATSRTTTAEAKPRSPRRRGAAGGRAAASSPRRTTAASGGDGVANAKEKLRALKQLYEEGAMDAKEYHARRKILVDQITGTTVPPAGGRAAARREAPDGDEPVRRKAANPSKVEHAPRPPSPEPATPTRAQYYEQKAQERRDLSKVQKPLSTGVDGIYYTGKAPEVIRRVEEELPEYKEGPEHAFLKVKTTLIKEELDNGQVRVTRIRKYYDGFTGKYKTMNKEEKMKPALQFNDMDEWEKDVDFQVKAGVSKAGEDNVADWKLDHWRQDDDEYARVAGEALEGKEYVTHSVNTGQKGMQWDGVHRYPEGDEEEGGKKKKGRGRRKGRKGKKGQPAEEDKWSGMDNDWGDAPSARKEREGKPEYKKAGRKGVFNVKKKQDNTYGEDVRALQKKGSFPKPRKNAQQYHDDGSAGGGFQTGEAWGAHKEHTGEYRPGGSHFHGDKWK